MVTTRPTNPGVEGFGAGVFDTSAGVKLNVVADLLDVCFEELRHVGRETGLDGC